MKFNDNLSEYNKSIFLILNEYDYKFKNNLFENIDYLENNKKDIRETDFNAKHLLRKPFFYILKDYDSFSEILLSPEIFNSYPKDKTQWIPLVLDEENEYNVKIKKIKNAKLCRYIDFLANSREEIDQNNKFQKSIELKGNYFILNTSELAYWHNTIQQFGIYLFIKNFIKDLKIIVLAPCKNNLCCLSLKQSDPMAAFGYSEITQMINKVYPDDVIILCVNTHENIVVENVYFFHNLQYHGHSLKTNFDVVYNKNLNPNVFTELANLFNKFYGQTIKNKKIFIYSEKKIEDDIFEIKTTLKENNTLTRAQINYLLRDRKAFAEKILNNNIFFKSEILIPETFTRYVTQEEKIEIIKFFQKYEYQIINIDNFSFNEQVKLFRSASHIACFKSSFALSGIYSGPDTSMIVLSLDTRYKFPHDYHLSSVQKIILSAMTSSINEKGESYSVQEVLEHLKEHEDIL